MGDFRHTPTPWAERESIKEIPIPSTRRRKRRTRRCLVESDESLHTQRNRQRVATEIDNTPPTTNFLRLPFGLNKRFPIRSKKMRSTSLPLALRSYNNLILPNSPSSLQNPNASPVPASPKRMIKKRITRNELVLGGEWRRITKKPLPLKKQPDLQPNPLCPLHIC